MPEKTDEERLKEAEEVAELRKQGLTYEQIGKKLDMGKTTAYSRMKTWEEHLGKEPAEEEEVKDVENLFKVIIKGDAFDTIRGTVGSVLGGGGEKASKKTGQITGSDLVTLKNSLLKMVREGLTTEQMKFIYENIEGIREGVKGGDEISKEVLKALPSRESVIESDEEEEEEQEEEKDKEKAKAEA